MTETSTHFCHDMQVYENTKGSLPNELRFYSGGWRGCVCYLILL